MHTAETSRPLIDRRIERAHARIFGKRNGRKEGNIVIFVYSHVIVVKRITYIIINITHIYTYIRVRICLYIYIHIIIYMCIYITHI